MITDDQLAGEQRIVWLEDPARFDYVREDLLARGTRSRPIGRSVLPGRIVGYAVLRADAPAPRWAGTFDRRVFWVKPYDRSEDPSGVYATGVPCEGVDPMTVVPGRAGEITRRAWFGAA